MNLHPERAFALRLAPFAIAAAAVALSACEESSQKAKEAFADRSTLPALLEQRANPRPGAALLSKLAKKDPQGRIDVAVIDSGVDYLHPELATQIKFRFKNGQVVGAGFDIQGNDGWAHPNLINPDLFALGAKAVVDGQISGSVEDPVKLLGSFNDAFMAKFLPALKAKAALQGTLFEKAGADSINVYLAGYILERDFDQEEYDDAKAKGHLITRAARSVPAAIKFWGDSRLRTVIDAPWAMDTRSSPVADYYNYIEGGDAFFEALKEAYAQFDAETGFSAALKPYAAFTKTRAPELQDALRDLHGSWASIRYRFPQAYPQAQIAKNFCANYSDAAWAKISDPALAPAEKAAVAVGESERLIGTWESFLKFYQASPDTADEEKLHAKDGEAFVPALRAQFKEAFAAPAKSPGSLAPKEPLLCVKKQDSYVTDPKLAAFGERAYHPLFDRNNVDDSAHGTHVSGIIAKQSKKIDIVPVRVITTGPQYFKNYAAKIREGFRTGFRAWLQDPVALEAARTKLKKLLPPNATADDVMPLVDDYLGTDFKSRYLDFYFFNEIVRAIKYVGNNKVKLANMSLGTSFERPPAPTSANDLKQLLKTEMTFLTYEYFKSVVGQAIQDHASKTLFVIASGNDGQWVDGKSRSALPCDISSPYLRGLEKLQPGQPSRFANNNIKNVLCVGSINPEDELSSFMNLPITDVPFVLSYGEAVLSPVKTTYCDGYAQDIQSEFGKFPQEPDFYNYSEGLYDEFFVQQGWMQAGLSGKALESARESSVNRLFEIFEGVMSLETAVKVSRCKEGKKPKARMSGTSMATPSVAGYLARSLVAELNKKKLSSEEIYDLPEYSPESIISALKAKSPVYGGESIVKDVPKVVSIKTWQKLPKEKSKKLSIVPVIDFGSIKP